MFYTIYKITNITNGKFYIGKHQTNNLNDDYFGSGKILRAAIKKYGFDNFKKEILEVYDQEWKMNLAEKIYVVVDREVSYNICPGGKGGWGYVNKFGLSSRLNSVVSLNTKQKISSKKIGKSLSQEHRKKISINNGMKNLNNSSKVAKSLKGKSKTEEHKRKISESLRRKRK